MDYIEIIFKICIIFKSIFSDFLILRLLIVVFVFFIVNNNVVINCVVLFS